MQNIIGAVLLLGTIAYYLYSWMEGQKQRQQRLEEFIVFLQKSIFVMETENVRVIDYFTRYRSKEEILSETLLEIAQKLKQNIYPEGQSVWEEVFQEKKQNWGFDEETFWILKEAGKGFFGKKRQENISFLQKSLRELELRQIKSREKDVQERKVWVPVGVLGGIMLMIIFV